jgi:hypothetical protein
MKMNNSFNRDYKDRRRPMFSPQERGLLLAMLWTLVLGGCIAAVVIRYFVITGG